MKGQYNPRGPLGTRVSRRKFLGRAGASAAGLMIVPPRVLGGPGHVPPSDKINVAFIGAGSQGLRVMLRFLQQPDVQAVAVSDPNQASADYPQWREHEFRDSVRKLLGASTGWDWLSPEAPIQLTPSLRVTSGMAGREPCQKIVDAYNGLAKRSGESRGCAAYVDFRELLEKERGIDAVVVGTTDNLHAAVAVAAMQKGKHVFCQKPMTHTLYEARRMAGIARRTGVATQVAVGNQASEATRQLCEWVWAGAIGPVREVLNWSSRPFWPQGIDRPKEAQPLPEGLDWDLWLGPAPNRPFNHAYLPVVWRGWCDFGCGALGDMGCYSFDTIFRVLKLEAPASVDASSSERHDETYPLASIIYFNFPARGEMPPVRLAWYDGGLLPARPEGMPEGQSMSGLAGEGLLFIGEQGMILGDFTGNRPTLLPESKMKNFTPPPKTLPRSPGTEREWLDACKGSKTKPGANFEFSAMVTETLQLGNIGLRTGQRLLWDRVSATIGNLPSAQQYIAPERRQGWAL
jgi:predicted dehydrogenase